MMDKKAQGLSLNTIIVAIVVLIVLVVLIMVFTGYFGTRFTPEVASCANSGGTCEPATEGCGINAFGEEVPRLFSPQCLVNGQPDKTQVCCSKGLGKGFQSGSGSDLESGNPGDETVPPPPQIPQPNP